MANGDIAEKVEGRIAGALKQADADDAVSDRFNEQVATKLAVEYERYVRSNLSKQAIASLEGEDDGDD